MSSKDILHEFAKQYAELDQQIEDRLVALSDQYLRSLRRACDRRTSTNCWWAEYRVAPIVTKAIAVVQSQRQARKEAADV